MNGLQRILLARRIKDWSDRHLILTGIVLFLVFAALAVLIVLMVIHAPSDSAGPPA